MKKYTLPAYHAYWQAILRAWLLTGLAFSSFNNQAQTITDYDGNVYNTVTIGTQEWLKGNLKVTHYRNGDPIPNVTDGTAWKTLTTGAYCDYSNKQEYSSTYGKLYNFYTVIDSRNLCPTGWHVPTSTEWTTLITYLGGERVAGGKLKEAGTSHWYMPNDGATDESGFTALPSGCRSKIGTFSYLTVYGFWWSSTENSTGDAWYWSVNCLAGDVLKDVFGRNNGYSVRCIKDQ